MNFRSILLFLPVATLIACNRVQERSSMVSGRRSNEMVDLNTYMVRKDRERIQNYMDRKKLDLTETETGLWYQILKDGEGEKLKEKDRVIMDYVCSLLDGTKCYSSEEIGPREYILGQSAMEAGLNEGLRLLKHGSEAIFIIPPFLAYGLTGDRRSIPPRTIIVYTVKIR